MEPELPLVILPPLYGAQADSWAALIELAPELGGNWMLVGGQMVFLHVLERHGVEARPTNDIDVVVDLRAEPSGLYRIDRTLRRAAFDQDQPTPEGPAHRCRRGGAVVDVLAPDNLGRRVQLGLGVGRTVSAPGTTQALRRSAVVIVELEGTRAEIRRPDLIGALLGKAAAVVRISSQTAASRAKHLADFDSLARLVGVGDRRSAELTKGERHLLDQAGTDPAMSRLGAASIALVIAEVG